jgi:membrane protease YdiL (CAAX protease family)
MSAIDPLNTPAETPTKVAWNRVALYYGIAFGFACLLGLGLKLAGANLISGSAALVFQLTLAFFYMPLPFVAALIVEKRASRGYLLGVEKRTVLRNFGRVALISFTVSIAIYLANLGMTLLLGNVLGIPGVGELVATQAGVVTAISQSMPEAATQANLAQTPPVLLLYALWPFVGIMAGFTINGLFAFGEEYGWRGVLMDELRPLGGVRANLLTGVMWGFWHAPVILLGFNYGAESFWGVLMMVVVMTPLSFILWRAREFSLSVVAPAIIHGAFNGFAGFFLFLTIGRSPLMAVPVGLAGALALTVVAAVMWRVAKPAPAVEPAVVCATVATRELAAE